MSPTRMALAVLACALAATGCKSSDSDKLQDAQGFCQELKTTWSERMSTCLPFDRSFTDFELAFMVDCQAIAKAQAEGTFTYDKAGAQACLDAFRAETCTEVWRDGGPPEVCQDAVVPRVAVGGACWAGDLDLECVGGYCRVNEAACNTPGECVAWVNEGGDCSADGRCGPGLWCSFPTCVPELVVTEVGPGAPCTVPGVTCRADLYCDTEPTTPVCAARKTSGACFGSSQCAFGYGCDCTDLACTTRSCVPEKRLGAACRPGYQECVTGLWCDDTSKCVRFLGVGQDCGGMPNGEFALCLDGWCEATLGLGAAAAPAGAAAASPATGTCRAFKALGATCDPAASGYGFLQCGPGATCLGGTCVVSYCGGGGFKT